VIVQAIAVRLSSKRLRVSAKKSSSFKIMSTIVLRGVHSFLPEASTPELLHTHSHVSSAGHPEVQPIFDKLGAAMDPNATFTYNAQAWRRPQRGRQ
jgi:hypothetical protein